MQKLLLSLGWKSLPLTFSLASTFSFVFWFFQQLEGPRNPQMEKIDLELKLKIATSAENQEEVAEEIARLVSYLFLPILTEQIALTRKLSFTDQ